MTEYTTLGKLKELETIRSMGYGKRYAVKTTHLGILLDVIIPATFGLITFRISRKWNKTLFYVQNLKHYTDKIKRSCKL